MRSVEPKSHWQTVVENLNTSTLDFYKSVEQAVAKRKLPDVSFDRTDMREGGVLSAKREYLLIKRGKLIFAVCSAPYGTGQFFSWWMLQRLPRFALLIALGLLAAIPISLIVMMAKFGLVMGFIAFAIVTPAAFYFVLNGGLFEEGEVDATLVAVPYLGRIYERLFSPATFYSEDTRAMFQESVRHAVKEVISDLCAAQGLRALAPEDSPMPAEDPAT